MLFASEPNNQSGLSILFVAYTIIRVCTMYSDAFSDRLSYKNGNKFNN